MNWRAVKLKDIWQAIKNPGNISLGTIVTVGLVFYLERGQIRDLINRPIEAEVQHAESEAQHATEDIHQLMDELGIMHHNFDGHNREADNTFTQLKDTDSMIIGELERLRIRYRRIQRDLNDMARDKTNIKPVEKKE